jgi:hypothetical protein
MSIPKEGIIVTHCTKALGSSVFAVPSTYTKATSTREGESDSYFVFILEGLFPKFRNKEWSEHHIKYKQHQK